MSLLGRQVPGPAAAAAVDRDLEQVLLGLADGSYVLSTPDGSVAESGVGVVALLGTPAERLVGQPIGDVLSARSSEQARLSFEQLLRAPTSDPSARPTFTVRCAGGTTRSLQFVVVCVPLALGWEFTSLLSELRSRDAGTWNPDELRLRHSRALEAVARVVRQGMQPDPSARLAGILIVVRDVDAPPLTHEDVDRRMAEQRAAARAAAAEAARRADETAGRRAPEHGEDPMAPALEDLVDSARVLRERVEDAERTAAVAALERDELHALRAQAASAGGETAALRAELQASEHELSSTREQLEVARAERHERDAELERARSALGATRGELEAVQGELEATTAALERTQAELEQARAAVAAIRAEFDFEPLAGGDGRQEAPAQPPGAGRPNLPAVGPGEAAALIALDGSFRRLDEAFCSLLGCREEDLRAARWPSIIDRENLPAHQEIARALKAGEIQSADIDTVYMHAQGLLVPIAGTISLHRPQPGGEPHFLFRADVSRTPGASGAL